MKSKPRKATKKPGRCWTIKKAWLSSLNRTTLIESLYEDRASAERHLVPGSAIPVSVVITELPSGKVKR